MMIEHLDTLAETSAKAISNIKFDKVVVWDSGNGNGATSGFLQNMANALPPMMNVLRDIAGVELPGYMPRMSQEPRKVDEVEVPHSVAVAKADGVVAPPVTPLSPMVGDGDGRSERARK
jgi:flotillin